jgi:multicomponent Na+:H+ antiporter subunit G
MSTVLMVLTVVLIGIGLVLMLIGSIGVVRLPDFFARTHASSKVDTVGILLVLFGVALQNGANLDSGKVLLAALFLLLSNPVSAHALARAAVRSGLRPWQREEKPAAPQPSPSSPENDRS